MRFCQGTADQSAPYLWAAIGKETQQEVGAMIVNERHKDREL